MIPTNISITKITQNFVFFEILHKCFINNDMFPNCFKISSFLLSIENMENFKYVHLAENYLPLPVRSHVNTFPQFTRVYE